MITDLVRFPDGWQLEQTKRGFFGIGGEHRVSADLYPTQHQALNALEMGNVVWIQL